MIWRHVILEAYAYEIEEMRQSGTSPRWVKAFDDAIDRGDYEMDGEAFKLTNCYVDPN